MMDNLSAPRQGTPRRPQNLELPVNVSRKDPEVAGVGNEGEDANRAVVAHLPPRAAALDLSARVVTSPASKNALEGLEDAVREFNRDTPNHKVDELIDRRTKFAALVDFARKDLADRCPDRKQAKRKRDQVWWKIKHALERFCRVVYSFSGVMDVLASSHPEIASLAWGAMKFLLAVSVNHQELKEKITEHLADIGEQFKIIDSYVRTFPETEMVDHVIGAYTSFLSFLQLSIDWCRENGFVKFFKNVAQPYASRIRPTIDSLNKHIVRIEARVAVHNTHGIATIQHDNLKLQEGLVEIKDFLASIGGEIYVQSNSQAAIVELLRSTVKAQRAVDPDPHRSGLPSEHHLEVFKDEFTIKAKLFPELLPATSHLEHTWVACKRLEAHHSYDALNLSVRAEIKAWTRSENSILLWIDGFSESCMAKWTTEFSVDVLLAAKEAGATVVYYFGDLATEDFEKSLAYLSSPRAVLHSFIIQLVQQHQDIVKRDPEWFTRTLFESARRSMRTTWAILSKLINGLPSSTIPLYMIVDSIDTTAELSHNSREFGSLLRKISRLVSAQTAQPIKVLLSSVTNNAVNQHIQTAPTHIILRIPQTFGKSNTVQAPPHLQRRALKRMVRLPDSDEEFGMKPADSFSFSDEEDRESLDFSSSSEATHESLRPSSGSACPNQLPIQTVLHAGTKDEPYRHHAQGSDSDSSGLIFSDSEDAIKPGKPRDPYEADIEFSSEESNEEP